MEERKVVRISFPATRYTNTFDYSLLFSLKQRRFVKPVLAKHLEFHYKVLEGVYLLISWSSPSCSPIAVQKVRLVADGDGVKTEELEEASWEHFTGTLKDQQCPEIIKDFIVAKPSCFHCYPEVDFTKIYPAEQVELLLKGGVCGKPEE